jgi:hypothetical protein
MATDKNTIRSWFKTGLKPTQAQFWAWMDSYWHKDEIIPQSNISNLESTLNAKAEKSQFDAHVNDSNAHANLVVGKENKNEKGAPSGYVPLNDFSKIESQYLDIVNDLNLGGAGSLMSAEQGKLLKTEIDGINTILKSDNLDLDNVQEIVDAIETVQITLNSILVNDLTTGGTTKALTAEQGKILDSNVIHKSGDEIKTGSLTADKFITKGGTSNHYIRGDGELAYFDDTVSRNIIKDVNDTDSVSGTVSEVLLRTYLIPANTFKANDVMYIKDFSVNEIPSNNNINKHRVRIGTTSSFATSSVLMEGNLNLPPSSNRAKYSFSCNIRNGFIGTLTMSATATSDVGRTKFIEIPFNPTIDNYLFTSIQLQFATDSQKQATFVVTN